MKKTSIIVACGLFSALAFSDTASVNGKIDLADPAPFNTSCFYKVHFKNSDFVSYANTVGKEQIFFETMIQDPTQVNKVDSETGINLISNKYTIRANNKSEAVGDVVFGAYFEEYNTNLNDFEIIEMFCSSK